MQHSTQRRSTAAPGEYFRNHWRKYGVALALVAAAAVARLLMPVDYVKNAPYSLFFLAVIVSAWYGGAGPGLLASVTGISIATYNYQADGGDLSDPGMILRLGTFLTLCVVTSLLCEASHRAHRRSEVRERNLRQLTDALPVLIAQIDTQQRYAFCNQAYSHWFNISADDAIGKAVWEVLGNEGYIAIRKPLERALAGETVHYETEFPVAGQIRHVSVTYVPARDSGGVVRGIFALAHDISDRIRAAQAQREADLRVKNILESVSDAFYALDKDWRFVYLNSQAERYFGETSETLLGESIWEEIPEKVGSIFDERYRAAMATGTAVSFETNSPFAEKWVEVHAYPGPDGLSVYLRDISRRKAAEQALLDSQQQLHLALQAADMGVWQWNLLAGKVIWSDQLEALHGMQPGEFDGQFETFQKLVHLDDWPRVQTELQATLDDDAPYNTEFRIVWSDGTVRWIGGTGMLFRDEQGRPIKMIGMALDITDRKAAEIALQQSEERFRLAAEVASDLIYEWDIGTGRVEWLGNVDLALGYGPGQFPRTLDDWHTRLHPNDRERVLAARRRHLSEGTSFAEEYRIVRHDGTHAIWTDRGSTLCDIHGRSYKWIGVTTDVTRQREAEVARGELLERERRARSAAEAAKAQLLDEDRRKNEFLAMLGHELRNPLGAITNAVQLFKLTDPTRPEHRQAEEVLERQTGQMARLVDDLLDISRITRGKIELRKEVVELEAVVQRAIDVGRTAIDGRRHALTVELPDEPVFLDADPARLEQILSNLLINAAKYMDPGGQVALIATATSGEVSVEIRDTGIGIAPEILPRIFDLFIQADRSLDRSQGGLGIGLTLVRSLVELHGGRVQAFSEGAGRGSRFVVTLPRHREAKTAMPVDQPTNGHSENKLKVLVVDDNPDIARLLAVLLTSSGHEVRTASDGPTALDEVTTFGPQAVLLDIGLPGMNGYEVARRLRKMPAQESTLLIAITGYGQATDREVAMESGFDHHLVKPVRVQMLQELLTAGRPAQPSGNVQA